MALVRVSVPYERDAAGGYKGAHEATFWAEQDETRTRDFTSRVSIFSWVSVPGESKPWYPHQISERKVVPFLHQLMVVESYYTPYKFGLRKPKRWGPR